MSPQTFYISESTNSAMLSCFSTVNGCKQLFVGNLAETKAYIFFKMPQYNHINIQPFFASAIASFERGNKTPIRI